ncbi:MAG: FAD-dependent monooxygenase [Pseudonocardia sp.]
MADRRDLTADVLVAGAGPTGLAVALQAAAHGARVRVVERRAQAFRPSRAIVVAPRTLEVLRPLGVVDALRDRAREVSSARLYLGSRTLDVEAGDLELPGTPYPPLTLLRQADVEEVLAAALAERGIVVERGVELVELDGPAGSGRPVLRTASGTERVRSRFVVGCDGAQSTVRGCAGIAWPGGPYGHDVLLADVELEGLTPHALHAAAGRSGLLFAFAAGEHAPWRLLATAPARRTGDPSVTVTELRDLLGVVWPAVRITSVAWAERIAVQHRFAARFRQGRVFLAGDAAHVHSPAAAQGMNTGLQDAANLGWKLAFASTAADPQQLLGSYDLERRPVARAVLCLTHLVFWAEAGTDPAAALLRGTLVPLAAPWLARLPGRRGLTTGALRTLSGLWVGYRASPLSVDGAGAGRIRAGDRLPDAQVGPGARRVHELLARPGTHVLAPATAPPPCRPNTWVHVHRLDAVPGGGLLAVRPDGYVGFSAGAQDRAGLARWLDRSGAATDPPRGDPA